MIASRRCSNLLLKSGSRLVSTSVSNDDISPIFTNRNPRNLEKLRIGYKPNGYHVDVKGKCFWHNLRLTVAGRGVTASVVHFENGEVITASTQEWNMKKQLYRTTDTAAYVNLARVLARRCLQSGIIEISCSIVAPKENGKVDSFLKTLQENGVSLAEAPQYKAPCPWDQFRPEKPWEVVE